MRHKRSGFEKSWWMADHRGAPGWLLVAAAAFLIGCAAMVAMHPSASAHTGSLHSATDDAWFASAISTATPTEAPVAAVAAQPCTLSAAKSA